MKSPSGDEGTILSQPTADSSKVNCPAGAREAGLGHFQKEPLPAAAGTGAENDPPMGAGPTKEQEVTKVGAKKVNRRKPRKG